MNLSEFKHWTRTATRNERRLVARQLAHRALQFHPGTKRREAHEAALLVLLDDPDPGVRFEIACVMAECDHAPRYFIQMFLDDTSAEIAHLTYRHSPLVHIQQLIEAVNRADPELNAILAQRQSVPPEICDELLRMRDRQVALLLLRNPGAALEAEHLHFLVETFAQDETIRQILLTHSQLPIADLHQLICLEIEREHEAEHAEGSQSARAHYEDPTQAAIEDATVAMAFCAVPSDRDDLATHLCETDAVTPTLMIRCLLSGNVVFACKIIAELTGVRSQRLESLLAARRYASLHPPLRKLDINLSVVNTLELLLEEVTEELGGVVPTHEFVEEDDEIESIFSSADQYAILGAVISRLADECPGAQETIPLLSRMRATLARESFSVMNGRSDAA